MLTIVTKAARVAAWWHVGQVRKGVVPTPYFCHLAEVAELVAEATGGSDPELVAAAYLHDAIEDAGRTRYEITQAFGSDVAGLVVEVSDNKALSYEQRKWEQVNDAGKLSSRAKTLKLADKIANLNSIHVDPPKNWNRERRLAYVAWARSVVGAMGGGVNPWLLEKFNHTAKLIEQKESVT